MIGEINIAKRLIPTRLWFILTFLFFNAPFGFSQKVGSVSFSLVKGNTQIEVLYSIYPVTDELKYESSLWLSIDGGATFIGPLKAVTGDAGKLKILPTGTLKIVWDIYKEVDDLEGKIVFQVRLNTEKIPIPTTKYALYQFSPNAPFGVMYAKRKYKGYYLKLQSNFNFSRTDYHASEKGLTNYNGDGYWVIGSQEKKSTLFVSGGYFGKLKPMLFYYAGLGYGQYRVLWDYTTYLPDDKIDKQGRALVKEVSRTGLLSELGLIYLLKNKYPISFGIQNVNFGYWTFSTGVGLKF